jgi:hypothetical protein
VKSKTNQHVIGFRLKAGWKKTLITFFKSKSNPRFSMLIQFQHIAFSVSVWYNIESTSFRPGGWFEESCECLSGDLYPVINK